MITFSQHSISCALPNLDTVQQWLIGVANHYQQIIQEIDYIFCTDEYLLQLNQQCLNHDTLTDVITFDLSDDDHQGILVGEVYISVDRVQENAKIFGVTFEQEVLRVIVHGFLHLLGYDDQTTAEKENMRALEEKWLAYWAASFAN